MSPTVYANRNLASGKHFWKGRKNVFQKTSPYNFLVSMVKPCLSRGFCEFTERSPQRREPGPLRVLNFQKRNLSKPKANWVFRSPFHCSTCSFFSVFTQLPVRKWVSSEFPVSNTPWKLEFCFYSVFHCADWFWTASDSSHREGVFSP